MKMIFLLLSLGSMVGAVNAGIDTAQCDQRSAMWLSPSLCLGSTPQCLTSQILPMHYEFHEILASSPKKTESGVNNAQCNERSPLFLSPSLCMKETMDEDDDSIRSFLTNFMIWASLTKDYDMQNHKSIEDAGQCMARGATTMPWEVNDEQVRSYLTTFLTLASLARDVELQKEENEQGVCWDMLEYKVGEETSCPSKLIHQTQPAWFDRTTTTQQTTVLHHAPYNFDPQNHPAMTSKKTRHGNNRSKSGSRFGLPREQVRKFANSMKSSLGHKWCRVPASMYV